MTDTPTPPEPGQPLWGDDLNAYLLSLEARIASNEALFATAGGRIDAVESSVTDLDERVSALDGRVAAVESKPEYIFNSYSWQYSNSAPPATGSQVRFNNTNLTLATLMDIRKIDGDGADRTPVFQQVGLGDIVRINDWNNAANLHRFRVAGAPTMDATNVQVPLAWEAGSGTIPNAKVNIAFLVSLDL